MFTQNIIKLSAAVYELSNVDNLFALSRNGEKSGPVTLTLCSIGF